MPRIPRRERITPPRWQAIDVSGRRCTGIRQQGAMFEGLIEFIEQTLFGLVNKLREEKSGLNRSSRADPAARLRQEEPGMTRVLIAKRW